MKLWIDDREHDARELAGQVRIKILLWDAKIEGLRNG